MHWGFSQEFLAEQLSKSSKKNLYYFFSENFTEQGRRKQGGRLQS